MGAVQVNVEFFKHVVYKTGPHRGVSHDGADEYVAAVVLVNDDFATAQVFDLEPQQTVALVRLEEGRVGVFTEEGLAGSRVDEITPVTLSRQPIECIIGKRKTFSLCKRQIQSTVRTVLKQIVLSNTAPTSL